MDTIVNTSQAMLLTMSQVLGLLRTLMESANQKEALISADDVEGLEEFLVEEAETACTLKQKEKELKYRAEDLRHAAGITNKAAQLKEICGLVSDIACRDRLTAARDELAEAVEQLNRQNAKLKELLKYRIGYTDFMLNLLHSPQSGLRSYNVQGIKDEGFGSYSLLDYHA
jgi:flagellar biosynthesis/type III secretory pathway chaperone